MYVLQAPLPLGSGCLPVHSTHVVHGLKTHVSTLTYEFSVRDY